MQWHSSGIQQQSPEDGYTERKPSGHCQAFQASGVGAKQ